MTALRMMSFIDARQWARVIYFSFFLCCRGCNSFARWRDLAIKLASPSPHNIKEAVPLMFFTIIKQYSCTILFVLRLERGKKENQYQSFSLPDRALRVERRCPKVPSSCQQKNTSLSPSAFLVYWYVFGSWQVCFCLIFKKNQEVRDVTSGNKDIMVLRDVSSHPNSLDDIQQLEMAFATFIEWE